MTVIDWRVWLLTALARRFGLQLFSYAVGTNGERCMVFATDIQTARQTAESFVIGLIAADLNAAKHAPSDVTPVSKVLH